MAEFKRFMMDVSNCGVRDLSPTMASYAPLSNETNLLASSVLSPSMAFHEAEIGVVVVVVAVAAVVGISASTIAAFASGTVRPVNNVVDRGANEIISTAVRLVGFGAENP
jgi:hypothetical protein